MHPGALPVSVGYAAIALAPEMGLLGVTAGEALGKRWPEARIISAAAVTGTAKPALAASAGWPLRGRRPWSPRSWAWVPASSSTP
jgi:hypothetical protein